MERAFSWKSFKPGNGNLGLMLSILGVIGSEGVGMGMIVIIPVFLLMAGLILIFRRTKWSKTVFALDALSAILFLLLLAGYVDLGISYYRR